MIRESVNRPKGVKRLTCKLICISYSQITEVVGPDELIGNAKGNKARNARRNITKYNLVTRRHIKMSRQGAGLLVN